MLNIGLVYDLREDYLAEGYSEEDVAEFDSPRTVEALEKTLTALGHQVERIGHGRRLCRELADGRRWDLVFNIAEGLHGRSREAQVPCLLELFDIPYTYSDPLVCAVTLDKAVTKRLIRDAGLRTPAFAVVRSAADIDRVALRYPLFAKPLAEGTGKGVDGRSRIQGPAELREVCGRLLARYGQPVLVEEYLPGREFTTGVTGTGARARVLGTMEILIKDQAHSSDYSFETKEKCEELVEYRPMEKGPLREAVEGLVLSAYRVLECRDAARADTRLDANGEPSFMEVNPLPGIHPHHSDLPMIATQEGWTYAQLIGAIVDSARERAGTRF